MRPNTPHYVLTVDNSITLGRHFYATATIRDTCFGHIHSGMMNSTVTNTNHPETEIFLRRILRLAMVEYEAESKCYAQL